MTQEEKQLLLKDLCARLPYKVKCRFETTIDTYQTIELSREGTNGLLVNFDDLYCYWFNEGFILPYLRPIHKLTNEELEELEFLTDSDYVDYCNEHHIDYHNLVPKGLALEAPDGMYKTE